MRTAIIPDSTAAQAYGRGSDSVGEAIGELFDEPDLFFAVPVLCLAGAAVGSPDRDQLLLLGHHPRGVVTPVRSDGRPELVTLSQLMGGADFAVPFLTAAELGSYILTAVPDRYPDSDMIIEIND